MRRLPYFVIAALAVVAIPVAVGRLLFARLVDREADQLRHLRLRGGQRQLATLPPLMRRYLQLVLPAQHKVATEVKMKQTGQLRTAPTAKWQAFEATQHISATAPGFIWSATLFPVYVRDKYLRGQGETMVSLMGIKELDRAQGPDVNQGAQLRYLAEMLWLPYAFLDERITWQSAGPAAVAATFELDSEIVRANFHFDSAGYINKVKADRYYRAADGSSTLRRWTATPGHYRPLAGITIPTEVTVTWHLPAGDFTWLKMRVTHYQPR